MHSFIFVRYISAIMRIFYILKFVLWHVIVKPSSCTGGGGGRSPQTYSASADQISAKSDNPLLSYFTGPQ